MKIAVCANKEELKKLKKMTIDYCAECNCYPVIDIFDNRESIIEAMIKNSYYIVIVAMYKAKGMEIVKHIHRHDRNVNIIWFSDDKDFAAFAFENGVKLFTVGFMNGEKLIEGLELCGISKRETDLYKVHLKADGK